MDSGLRCFFGEEWNWNEREDYVSYASTDQNWKKKLPTQGWNFFYYWFDDGAGYFSSRP